MKKLINKEGFTLGGHGKLTNRKRFIVLSLFSLFCFVRKFCTVLVYGATFLLVFFYLPPIGFISALIALENIANVFHFLRPGKFI